MSYDSRLAQTGRKVANARRKYYGSFDYGSGIDARLRGGSFSFSRKYAWGGPDGKTWIPEIDETEVDEPEVQELIAKYFRKHPNDAWKFGKDPETGLDRGTGLDYGAGFEGMSSGGTNWGGLASLALGMVGSGIQSYNSMKDKSNALSHKYDVFGTNELTGLTDNNALLSTMANTPLLSGATAKDFRDKTVGQDILSALSTGVSATINSGGNYWVGLGAMALDAGKSVWERINAKNKAKEATLEAKRKNRQFFKDMAIAGQDVDARNDWMRMYGYHNDPFEYALGGPLHSNGGDYNGGLTFINAGGRHEDNPYEGVPSGVDAEGNPNLVEEGEVIWNNDYVFSDRLQIPFELKEKYKLRGDNITFADAITKLTKENTMSPNDPITIATTKAIVNEFMDAQEAVRGQRQMAARRELEAARADDFLAQLDAAQGMAPQGMALPQMGALPNEAPVTEGEMMPPGYAFGGNKFDDGGEIWRKFLKDLEAYSGSIKAGNIAGTYSPDAKFPLGEFKTIKELENSEVYKKFTDFILNNADKEHVQNYLKKLDERTGGSAKKLFVDGKLRDDWKEIYTHRRNDGVGGIYHFSGDVSKLTAPKSSEDKQQELIELLQGTPFPGHLENYPNIRTAVKNGKLYYLDTDTIKFYDNVNDIPGYKAPAAKQKPTTGVGVPVRGYPGILDMGDGTFWDENTGQYLPGIPGTETLDASSVTAAYDPKKGKKSIETLNATTKDDIIPYKYRPTWQREAPVIGSAMAALYGMLNRPDYSNADRIIEAAARMGRPINIPVETIGDYRRRNPFDERYLVNMANQNRAAGARGIANTSGGNRAMDLLGSMSLAHSSQYDLGEIMRQAYLANRQDDAQVADFNRGTNVYNMNAINQRNLSQAQLNTHREQAGLSGLSQGYGLRQTIKDSWDSATMESLNSMLASLGAIGKENEEYNLLTSMAEHGYYPWYYGDRGALQYVPQKTKNGGKLNRKKRRF